MASTFLSSEKSRYASFLYGIRPTWSSLSLGFSLTLFSLSPEPLYTLYQQLDKQVNQVVHLIPCRWAPLSDLPFHSAGYAADHVLRYVAGDLGVLLEAPGRVLVPVLPEGHVDPQLVSGPDEDAPQFLVHAQQHLELVAVFGDPELVDQPEGVPDQELVVRGYAHVDAAL